MEIPVYVVDAFTSLPFRGNPAAVCPLVHELSDELYQKIAAEMNLSETAFIIKLKPSDDFTTAHRFRLRWFTPTNEVNLCGHATLATAAVLFQHEKNVNSKLVFETKSGELCVIQQGAARFLMDFPLYPPTREDANEFRDVIKAAVGDIPVQDVYLCGNTKKLLVRLSDTCDRSVLTNLKVDPAAVMASESTGKVKGVILTMIGAPDCQPGYDFYSRFFSPWNGIPEDPVTGSAHTVLGSYWSEKLGKKRMLGNYYFVGTSCPHKDSTIGEKNLVGTYFSVPQGKAFQCSRRGGELELEVRDDGRINIAGQTVTVMRGTITL